MTLESLLKIAVPVIWVVVGYLVGSFFEARAWRKAMGRARKR